MDWLSVLLNPVVIFKERNFSKVLVKLLEMHSAAPDPCLNLYLLLSCWEKTQWKFMSEINTVIFILIISMSIEQDKSRSSSKLVLNPSRDILPQGH